MEWTLRQLRVFVAVADAGSLSAAAHGLAIAQPAVSITVRKLEQATGTRLFDRRPTGVVPTLEGRAFLEHARAIVAQAGKAQQHLRELRGLEKGELVIGAPTMVATYFLPDLLNAFFKRHPGIAVRIVQDGAEAIAERVRRAELELGFIADRGRYSDLGTALIERHPMDACVATFDPRARERRLGWRDLLRSPLILFPPNYYQRARLEEMAGRLRMRVKVVAETESVPLMLSLVREGRGTATLLRVCTAGVSGVVSLPLPPGSDVPIAICYRKDQVLSHAGKAFLTLARRFRTSNAAVAALTGGGGPA